MPTTAQDRTTRGPVAALLILLSLLLGSAASASPSDLRGPAARLGASRGGPSAALLPAGTRNPLDDEAPGPELGSALPPPTVSGPVTETLWTLPRAGFDSAQDVPPRSLAGASYRARAPPAF